MTKIRSRRCADCGRFIADHMLPASREDFIPLNEFGPEIGEWTCPECLERDRYEK